MNMKVRRMDTSPRARTVVVRFCIRKLAVFLKSYYTLSRTFRRRHTPMCAAESLSLSRSCEALLPTFFCHRWRPSAQQFRQAVCQRSSSMRSPAGQCNYNTIVLKTSRGENRKFYQGRETLTARRIRPGTGPSATRPACPSRAASRASPPPPCAGRCSRATGARAQET